MSPAPGTGPGGGLGEAEKAELLAYARAVIGAALGDSLAVLPADPERFGRDCGAFVSLHERGSLRGCIGRMSAEGLLVHTVAEMARAAAFEDPRFPRLRREELPEVAIEITVLSPMRAIDDPKEIEIGRHGVHLSLAGRSAVFLPQVAPEQGWGREELLDNLALKAGLPPASWNRSEARLSVFEGLVFGEAGGTRS